MCKAARSKNLMETAFRFGIYYINYLLFFFFERRDVSIICIAQLLQNKYHHLNIIVVTDGILSCHRCYASMQSVDTRQAPEMYQVLPFFYVNEPRTKTICGRGWGEQKRHSSLPKDQIGSSATRCYFLFNKVENDKYTFKQHNLFILYI